jgi:ABC-type dipeptide/oligopeptide/nickel transport system ATPase subunit
MGTDTELIQVINVVEDAAEFKKRLILTSFDTTKAFDSVNKPLMVAAWERLGVPPDIADYLVNIDVGGDTLIKTPHAKSVIAQLQKGQCLRDVKVNDEKAKSTANWVRTFEARDGIGQGDSPSANAWIAIYDILLCALDEIEEEVKKNESVIEEMEHKMIKSEQEIEVLNFLNKTVKEKGINFSGGQRKRIGLTRSLFVEKDIYIFDEPTNSLDLSTAKKFIKNIKKFLFNKTVIIITHDKNILKYCNKVFVLKNKKLYLVKKN